MTYDGKLFEGRDRINVLLGHEVQSSRQDQHINTATAFPSTMTRDEVLANMGAAGTTHPVQSTLGAEDNMLSFFGRLNYTMMDKYLLTVTMRADGSANLPKVTVGDIFHPQQSHGVLWTKTSWKAAETGCPT